MGDPADESLAPVAATEVVPVSALPPAPTTKALWWEVAAVLAVGVVPNMAGAVVSLCHPAPPMPSWLDGFSLSVLSACTIFVTLYLIARSGESWESFGITRPQLWDVAYGLLLLLASSMIGRLIPSFIWESESHGASDYAGPQGRVEWVIVVIKYGLAAFSEEIVTRAYLITRLSFLLRSRGEAVLVAAILFASYHAYQGLHGLAHSFAFGILYGITFLALGRVWPLAIAHALYNIRIELHLS